MYISISVAILLIFFNAVTIIETSANQIVENGGKFGKGIIGLVVEEIEEDLNKPSGGKFGGYLTGLVIQEEDEDKSNENLLDLEFEGDLDEEEVVEDNLQGEIYTENSYLVYYMLLGFLAFCVLALSAVFFLPRLKEYT